MELIKNKKEIFSCEEHIDIGIDEYIDMNGISPSIEKVRDKECDYCIKKAIYRIYSI